MNRTLALFALAASLSSPAAFAQTSVKDPWVRGTVAQQKATGAFMKLETKQPVALVSAGLVSDTPNTPVTFIDSKTRLSAESLPYRTRPYS